MEKQLWQSKWTFIIAAVGAAAGLGNLWRFPFQVYDHGGAAFIIAYLIIMIVVGMSMAIGEVAFGQKSRSSMPDAIKEVNPYLTFIGWTATFTLLVVIFYYVTVIGWTVDYLYYSIRALFDGSFAWAGNSSDFFYKEILGLTGGVGEKGSLSLPVLYGVITTFICLYFFTFKGVKSIGKVVWVTATFPFIALIILAIKGITLPGSELGLSYLINVDWSYLAKLDTWAAAAGQIFFSIGIGLAYLVVYGSKKPEKEELVRTTIYVVLGNTLVSFLSAIAVFSSLGYMAASQGIGINEVASGGPGLIFVTLPAIFTTFGTIAGPIFAIIFFITVFFLAIDSAMAILETPAATIGKKFKKMKTEYIFLILTIIAFIGSIPFMYGNGLYLLDIVDYYLMQYAIVIIGLLEIILFIFIWKKHSKYIMKRSDFSKKIVNKYTLLGAWIISALGIFTLVVLNFTSGFLVYDSYTPSELMIGVYVLMTVLALGIIINIYELCNIKHKKNKKHKNKK